ncbi:MAG: prepilin-type N-terminal cleavage/methylation domain-containing protein [Solobacterium sp.]|nr:prepilin-type N-terminal cleavage/methylation domain-containing protein [Solobacterium sp.]
MNKGFSLMEMCIVIFVVSIFICVLDFFYKDIDYSYYLFPSLYHYQPRRKTPCFSNGDIRRYR